MQDDNLIKEQLEYADSEPVSTISGSSERVATIVGPRIVSSGSRNWRRSKRLFEKRSRRVTFWS